MNVNIDTDYRRWLGVSAALAGLIAVIINLIQGDVVLAAILATAVGGFTAGLIWWTRPTRGGLHQSHAAAQAGASGDDIIVYWRPG